jgi:hypothetical protein
MSRLVRRVEMLADNDKHDEKSDVLGASGAPASLRPPTGEGGKLMANLGRTMPRDREVVFAKSAAALTSPRLRGLVKGSPEPAKYPAANRLFHATKVES